MTATAIPDVRREFGYGPTGQLILESVYSQPDGTLLERPIRMERRGPPLVEHFQGPSQSLSWRLDSLYDDLGRPVERVLLENGDGTTQRSTMRYDEQAKHSFEELDVDGDGTLDARIARQYDAWNRLLVVETDVGADDLIEVRVDYTWDNDLLSAVESDTDGDGVIGNRGPTSTMTRSASSVKYVTEMRATCWVESAGSTPITAHPERWQSH